MAQADIAHLLKDKYREAKEKNPRFSLRAFAARIGLSPGGLSQVLSRKKHLSVSRAHEIAEALGLSDDEKEHFLLIAQIENAKTLGLKADLQEKLARINPSNPGVHNLAVDQFKMLSDWYGLAVLETVTGPGRHWTSRQIAGFIGISKIEAELTLERLERLELIEQQPDGTYRRTADRVLATSHLPSEAFRNYYRGVLQRAEDSLEEQTPAEKVIGTEVFAFDPTHLEEVRALTDQYLDGLQAIARKGRSRSQLYQAFVDVFRLSQPTNEPGAES